MRGKPQCTEHLLWWIFFLVCRERTAASGPHHHRPLHRRRGPTGGRITAEASTPWGATPVPELAALVSPLAVEAPLSNNTLQAQRLHAVMMMGEGSKHSVPQARPKLFSIFSNKVENAIGACSSHWRCSFSRARLAGCTPSCCSAAGESGLSASARPPENEHFPLRGATPARSASRIAAPRVHREDPAKEDVEGQRPPAPLVSNGSHVLKRARPALPRHRPRASCAPLPQHSAEPGALLPGCCR